jgi:type IV secretion system protein VirB4
MFPGNGKFNVFPLWLSEEHHARLSFVFAPHLGHPRSEDLDAEYLNILETRTRTPFFQDVYVDGVRVMLILGPTGTGKSVHGNQLIALEQKYGGFSYIFDIGGSYESVVELYGGRVDRIGKDGPRVNPFALQPTESNLKFLYSFVRLLLANGGAELEPEDDDVIHKAVQDMYLLDRENRRLSNLYLPKKLDRYLSKWVRDGVYHAIFDNVEDSLSLSRLQCFDFQGVNNEQYADLIEPLMVWLLRRINDVLCDRANLGVPKHILIEEIFSSMKNRQLLEGTLASIKTVRKNLGGVTLIGQSAEDLGENADSIVNSCSSFLFLKDPTFNRKRYTELFKMNEQQIALFESLQDREALYIRRDGLTKVVILNLDSRSYAIFSTKPKDRVRRSKLIAKYGLTGGIERFAQGEAVLLERN